MAGQCRTCHGTDGIARIPVAPNIAGEPAEYLSRQLKAFKNGNRQHEMMSVVAINLDDAEITNVSQWYASQVIDATLAPGLNADSAPAMCSACHGANGIATRPDTPNLAGESPIYIETQLKAFRNGKREHEAMARIAAALSDIQMRDVSDWYSKMEVSVSTPDTPGQ